MQNIRTKKTVATPQVLTQKTQNLPDRWSPSVIKNGTGFGFAFIAKRLGLKVFEIANTNSMLPVMDYNHTLYCRPINKNTKLKMYDICIYQDSIDKTRLIVHRIVNAEWNKYNRQNERYKFKGDNNLFSDGWIKRENVLWRVELISYAR